MGTDSAKQLAGSPLSGISAAPPSPGGAASAPAESGGALQDILPEIQALAKKCGGLDKLAEIVGNLRTNKPV